MQNNIIQFKDHTFDNSCYNFTEFQLAHMQWLEQQPFFESWASGPINSNDVLGKGEWRNGPRKPGPVCVIINGSDKSNRLIRIAQKKVQRVIISRLTKNDDELRDCTQDEDYAGAQVPVTYSINKSLLS